MRMTWDAPSTSPSRVPAVRYPPDQDHRSHEAEGYQDPRDRPDEVDVEVAHVLRAAGQAPGEGDGDADPRRGRGELQELDPGHLAQVGERVLPVVVLEVRVRRDRYRRVEGEGPGEVLVGEDDEADGHLDGVDEERSEEVLLPPHAMGGVHARKAVDPVLDRGEDPVEPSRRPSVHSDDVRGQNPAG
jgi:hypothetical protein